ncbi:Regulator of ribonuclease activity B [Colwellia chukchiensis]|uniref:Regulator of ribonuclease activity B n=1 Tax=Colwellia chukchiensis TaxID=641665 RepID=A0A1H7S7S7_9GAMM|nr:ribonuclease E inhibitor RraB [Colwellia chukchiensis]SEL67784.1 Regulator of ribonuclease activity B [Colwellia chukchiensis]
MQRNEELFPHDNVGNALWEMLTAGDDLTKEREFEFSVIFSEQSQALKFGQLLLENNQKLSFCPYQGEEGFPWEITAYPFMAASYENIAAYQELLTTSAEPFAGKYDGWYCLDASKK